MLRLLIRSIFLLGLAALLVLPAAGAGPGGREGTTTGRLVELHADQIGEDPIPGFGLDTGARMRMLDPDQPRELVGQRVAVEDRSGVAGLQGAAEQTSGVRRVAASADDVRETAVVLVKFRNATSEPVTAAQLESTVFTGAASVHDFYEQQSGGTTSIEGLANPSGDVFGWWQLPVDKPTACTVDDMFDLKDSLLAYDGTQGVNLASYEHVVVWFADNSACDWAGLGELPGSWSWINGYDDTSVIAHEIGHNMGAHHAASLSCGSSTIKVSRSGCSYSEYGDPLDVMGSSSALMSSWHRAQVQQLPVAALQTVTTAGSYVLDEANGAVADDPRLLLVPRQVGSAPVTEYFAIELRSPFGAFDAFAPSSAAVTGVTIRLVPALSVIDVSELLDAHPGSGGFSNAPLQVGETFTDPASGVTITNTLTGSGSATLAVSVTEGDATAPSAPVAQASVSVVAGVTLNWAAATDNVGVDHYEVRRDGQPVATTPAGIRSFTDRPPATAATAVYRVYAYDGAGNSTSSAPLTVALPDVVAPELAQVVAVRRSDGRVQLSFAATDNRGVAGYRVEWIGGSASSATAVWVHEGAPAAVTSYAVRAVDAAGNLSATLSATASALSPPVLASPPAAKPATTTSGGKPKVIVTLGRGTRIVVTVRGASRITAKARGWKAVSAGARLTGVLPAKLVRSRSAKLEVRAIVGGKPVSASFTIRRGRI